jgi:hypothetical protein
VVAALLHIRHPDRRHDVYVRYKSIPSKSPLKMEVKCASETAVPSYRTLISTFVAALNLVTIQKNIASLHQSVLHFKMANGLTAEVQI